MKKILFLMALISASCSYNDNKIESAINNLIVESEVLFGTVNKGSPVVVKTISILNDENSTVNISPELVSSDFQTIYNGCSSLKKGKSCTIKVGMLTTSEGEKTAVLDLGTESVALSGEVEEPNQGQANYEIKIGGAVETSIDYGLVSGISIKTIEIKNIGDSDNAPLSISVPAGFEIVQNTCLKALKRTQSCLIKVSFDANGGHEDAVVSGELEIGSFSIDLLAEVASSVAGGSEVKVLKGAIEISEDDLGPVSSQQILTYTIVNEANEATAPVAITQDNSNFTIIYNSCEEKRLKTNQSCLVKVLFVSKGRAPGVYLTNLSILDSELALSAQIAGVIPQYLVEVSNNIGSYTGVVPGLIDSGTVLEIQFSNQEAYDLNITGCDSVVGRVCHVVVNSARSINAQYSLKEDYKINGFSAWFQLDTNLDAILLPHRVRMDEWGYAGGKISGQFLADNPLAFVDSHTNGQAVEVSVDKAGLDVSTDNYATLGSSGMLYVDNAPSYGFEIESQVADLYKITLSVISPDNSYSKDYFIDIDDPNKFKMATSGNGFSCYVKHNGEAYCAGANINGQLGIGNNVSVSSLTRTQAGGNSFNQFLEIKAGTNFACGINPSGRLYCWGLGDNGRLGSLGGSTNVPRAVGGYFSTNSARTFAVGNVHACATGVDNNTYCWGYGGRGQLGNNALAEAPTPVQVVMPPELSGHYFKELSAGGGATCGIATNNKLYCWGSSGLEATSPLGVLGSQSSLVPIKISGAYDSYLAGMGEDDYDSDDYLKENDVVQKISVGLQHICAIADKRLLCWGNNEYSQAGIIRTGMFNMVVEIPLKINLAVLSESNIKDVSSQARKTCALTDDHVVYCIGKNDVGELGPDLYMYGTLQNNKIEDYSSSPFSDERKTSLGIGPMAHQSIVLTGSDEVYVFGINENGQSGDLSSDYEIPYKVNIP